MAYECPRCGKPVQRRTSRTAGVAGGAVGALIASAFAGFECPACGKIPKSEFPPEVRSKMRRGSCIMVLVAALILAAVIGILIAVNQ